MPGFADGPAEPSAGFAAAPLVGTEAPSGSEQISDPGYLREANPNPNPKILTQTLTRTLTPPQRRVGASRSRTLGRPSELDVSGPALVAVQARTEPVAGRGACSCSRTTPLVGSTLRVE